MRPWFCRNAFKISIPSINRFGFIPPAGSYTGEKVSQTEPGSGREHPLVAIVGPTGSGKSEISLALARMIPAEVVNCDSVQIYRYLDIGTAKLPASEQHGIPHHLLDIADPNEVFTAGGFARLARPILRRIADTGKVPLVVGGTGFYLSALIDGLFEGPGRDDRLRKRLADRESARPGSLHRILTRLDAKSAGKIHPRDVKKLIRALEICLLTRRPLSALYREGRNRLTGFRPLKIGLNPPREALYEHLNSRARRMYERGLIDEVRHILSLGFRKESKALEALGYKQALAVLAGELSEEEAIALTGQETRRYAKRQWTWFRRDPDIVWLSGFGNEAATQAAAIERVSGYLAAFPGVQ
ncbi:MAG: tRNA (adenosine(37)-N6)-dimethylallyltransferase MiaA [bacterium]|nr:tRNA (adenosine(37)-N6)-dimethylallyltransferase MiaA [bacterium]